MPPFLVLQMSGRRFRDTPTSLTAPATRSVSPLCPHSGVFPSPKTEQTTDLPHQRASIVAFLKNRVVLEGEVNPRFRHSISKKQVLRLPSICSAKTYFCHSKLQKLSPQTVTPFVTPTRKSPILGTKKGRHNNLP